MGRDPRGLAGETERRQGNNSLERPTPSPSQQEETKLGAPGSPCEVPGSSIMGLSNWLLINWIEQTSQMNQIDRTCLRRVELRSSRVPT